MFLRQENRQLVHILTLFLIVQFGGILLIPIFAPTPLTSTYTISPVQIIIFLAVVIIVVPVLTLLFIKFYHGSRMFVYFEAYAIGGPAFLLFSGIIYYFFPKVPLPLTISFAFLLAALLIIAKNKRQSLRNLAAIIASLGLGLIVGTSFSLSLTYLILVVLAIYDYIAVFVTKHMVTLAKAFMSRNIAFFIGSTDIEAVPFGSLSKEEQKGYKKHEQEVRSLNNPIMNKILKAGDVPLLAQIQLGTGDLIIPLIVAVSAYSLFFNYYLSIVVATGAGFGILLTTLYLRKYRQRVQFLPAVPPQLAFISIALAVGLPFVKISFLSYSLLLLIIGLIALFFAFYMPIRIASKRPLYDHSKELHKA